MNGRVKKGKVLNIYSVSARKPIVFRLWDEWC